MINFGNVVNGSNRSRGDWGRTGSRLEIMSYRYKITTE